MEKPFENLIKHLERKKPKKGCPNGKDHFVSKPIYRYEKNDNLHSLWIDYNYYYVYITYDEDKVWNPYKLSIDKPCVIERCGGQELGTAFYESVWSDEESVWIDLQQKWKKTIK